MKKHGTICVWGPQVVIDSLSGRHMMLQLRKRKGYEAEDVLDESAADSEGALCECELMWRTHNRSPLELDLCSLFVMPSRTAPHAQAGSNQKPCKLTDSLHLPPVQLRMQAAALLCRVAVGPRGVVAGAWAGAGRWPGGGDRGGPPPVGRGGPRRGAHLHHRVGAHVRAPAEDHDPVRAPQHQVRRPLNIPVLVPSCIGTVSSRRA